ncbi:MAG: carbohydrate ABC transporter permease [Acidimicrobiales bacterium]
MAAPFVLGVALLVAAPAVATVTLALFDYDLVRSPRFIGLDNFAELADDDVFRISLRNSMAFVALSVPLRLGGALAAALLLHRRTRLAAAGRTAVFLPSVVPDVAYGLVWLWLLNPLYGPVNVVLGAVGAPTPSWLTEPVAAQAAVVLIGAFQIGEGMVITLAARRSLPDELYETAVLEGYRPWALFRRITLPLLAPTLLLLAFRDVVHAFQSSFVPALVVTGGGPPPFSTTYLPLFVYRTGFEYLRYGYAAAATVVMLGVTALMIVAQWGVVRRRGTGTGPGSHR